MKVFVVNCGSSSIKYQLFDMTNESVLARGIMERVGSADAKLAHVVGEKKHEKQVAAPNHTAGMRFILEALVDPQIGVLKSIGEINAVGHRVLHGGEKISATCVIDEKVIAVIKENFVLGPLHNPPNLMGIEAAMKDMPGVPNVAVFDTAFFSTLPPKAYRYAVPEEWYRKHHVRRYGFHGTSHRYVTRRSAQLLDKPLDQVNLITVHLGNGCSMTAVAGGKAIDHSMGMTPLEGLVMGTRSGDIDPAILPYMIGRANLTPEQIDTILNKSSGLLGLSGISNDMRDLLAAEAKGEKYAELALSVFVYRILKYIGSYYTILPALDAIVLTGGIGENSLPIRHRVCEGLSRLGVRLDPQRNERTIRGVHGPISAEGSPLAVWVVPTNEELMIARDTAEAVKRQ